MPRSLSQHLIQTLSDWLIAFFGAFLCLWFVVTQPVFNNQPQQLLQIVNTDQLKQHVQLLTDGFAPRTIDYDNLNTTADYIYQQFASVGTPEYQTIRTISQDYRNVMLQLGPDTEELYVIGAHYDAENNSVDTEGNASGVATLIELAKELAENINKLEIGVVLIAYPLSLNQTQHIAETGSYFHAESLQKSNKKVRLMISLDGVGRKNISIDSSNTKQINSLNLTGRLNDFNSIRALKKGFEGVNSLSLSSHKLLEIFNKPQLSDHQSYWSQGFPAVLISDTELRKSREAPHNEQSINKLDYEKMGMLVSSLSQVVLKSRAVGNDKTRLAQRNAELTQQNTESIIKSVFY